MPLPPGYSKATWDRVRNSDEIRAFLREGIAAGHWPVYIYGHRGTGKTCLAALIHASVSTGAIWERADSLLDELSQFRRTAEDGKRWERLVGCRLLTLDDLGVRMPTEFMSAKLFDLLEARKGRPTVITSNHPLQRLEGHAAPLGELFDDRILSRLAAGRMVCLQGADRRAGQGKGIVIGGAK